MENKKVAVAVAVALGASVSTANAQFVVPGASGGAVITGTATETSATAPTGLASTFNFTTNTKNSIVGGVAIPTEITETAAPSIINADGNNNSIAAGLATANSSSQGEGGLTGSGDLTASFEADATDLLAQTFVQNGGTYDSFLPVMADVDQVALTYALDHVSGDISLSIPGFDFGPF